MRIRLIPREERFFDMFVEDAANVLGAARQLEAMLRTYDDVEQRAKELFAMEHRGDEISHDIGQQAQHDVRDAVRPRGDPRPASAAWTTSSTSSRRSPTRSSSTASTRRRRRGRAGRDHRQAVRADPRGARAPAGVQGPRASTGSRSTASRTRATGSPRAAIAGLFYDEKDPIDLVKWKDIYGLLEDAIDKAEDVANIIERISSSTPEGLDR